MKITKERILFIFLLIFSGYLKAQITITGKVVNEANEPIEFANIALLANDTSSIITGTITSEQGEFKIESKQNNSYILQVSYVGFSVFTKKIDSSIDIGEIQLSRDNDLAEVIVTSTRPFIKREVDRLVFNVNESPHTSGRELTDLLKITPGVLVINNSVSILGKSSIRIMINGRITNIPSGGLMNFLSSIPSDDIKTIEVITTPPAKYDAGGNFGLINIIYKKRDNFWSSRINGRYIQTTYPAYAGGANFQYRKDKFSLYLDTNGKIGHEAVIEKSDLFYPSQFWSGVTIRKDRKDYLSGRISMQYDVSDRFIWGLQCIGGFENPDVRDDNETKIYNNNFIDSLVVSNGFNDINNYNYSLNLYSDLALDTLGRTVSFTLDYLNFFENQDRDFETKSILENGTSANIFSSSNNQSEQDINNYSAKVDFVHPIKKLALSYGGKISFINNNNGVSFFDLQSGEPVLDPNQSDEFDYKENTQALYLSASRKMNDKLSLKLGLRFENTNTEGNSKSVNIPNKRNYSRLFPTGYLSYNPNDKNSFSLSYSKRIKRPSYWELNPFRWYVNDFNYSEGNPFLQPSFTDNFEFNHIFNGNLTTIVFMSITNDGFGQVPIVDEDTNVLIFSRDNFFNRYSYGLGLVYRMSKLSWLSSYIHTQVYYSDTEFFDIAPALIDTEQNGATYTISNYNSIILNKAKTILADVNFWYKSPQRTGLFLKEDSYSIDFGIRFLLMENKLQASFNVYDILRTSNPNLTTNYNNGIVRVANVYYDNRYFKIGLSYRFGNTKIRGRKRRVGNREEKGRI